MTTQNRPWPMDPTRPVIQLAEPRLQRLFLNGGGRCASITEYAHATGIDVVTLTGLLSEHLDAGLLGLEAVGGEVFVHTAPDGRTPGGDTPQVPPNLWEMLRREGDTDHAYRLWRLVRELEEGGWSVEADPRRIPPTSVGEIALVALRLGGYVAPVIVLPSADELAHPAGVLSRYERRGLSIVAVICRRGELDVMTTAARRWMFSRPVRSPLSVVVLEAPRYQPVMISTMDTSVIPTSVTREQLTQLVDPDAPDGIDGRDTPH